MRATLQIQSEPRGETYRELLRLARVHCHGAALVVRPSLGLSSDAREVLMQIEPDLLSRRDQSTWPGTVLTQGTAEVITYRLTDRVVETLRSAADDLYAWTQPELPEDPCFVRKDGSPWLFSVSHEREAYLSLDEREERAVREALPHVLLLPIQPH